MEICKKEFSEILGRFQFSTLVLVLLIGIASVDLHAQCIRTTQFGSLTVSGQTTSPTNISTCVFTNEFSAITVDDPGQYEFTISLSDGYLTFTDESNTVIAHGATPLSVPLSDTGTYRLHYAANASCGHESGCRTSTAQYVGPVGCIRNTRFGSLTISDQTTSPTNISTCVFTNEYSTITVNDPGQYEFTINIAGGYLTLTDDFNTIIDQGTTPLAVSIVNPGTYRLHYAENAFCGHESGCRTSTAQYLSPPAGGRISVQIGVGSEIASNSLYMPAYRFSETSGNNANRSFAIYEEDEMISAGIAPGTVIESIGFEKGDGGTLAGQNLEMKIYMRTGISSPPLASTSWTDAIAGATLVFDDDIAFTAESDWVDFSFSTPFVYQGGTLEIATENFIDGPSPYSTGAFEWKYDDAFGTDHAIGRVSVGSFSSNNLISSASYSFRPNTRFVVRDDLVFRERFEQE